MRELRITSNSVIAEMELHHRTAGLSEQTESIFATGCYAAIDQHATRRLRQWLCRKHKVQFGKYVRFPGSPALFRERRAFRGRRHDLVREPDAGNPPVRFDERRLETEPWRGVRHRHQRKLPGTATPYAYRHRDDALVALAHPQSDHRLALRRVVNERLTVWANELARHREP